MITVKVENTAGQTVKLRLPDDGKLVEVLRKRARRETLESIKVVSGKVQEQDPVEAEMDQLRTEYTERTGKSPDRRWKEPTLRRKLEELAEDDADLDDEDDPESDEE